VCGFWGARLAAGTESCKKRDVVRNKEILQSESLGSGGDDEYGIKKDGEDGPRAGGERKQLDPLVRHDCRSKKARYSEM